MLLNNISNGLNAIDKAATSQVPWIYLALFMVIAILFTGYKIFNYLIKNIETQRVENQKWDQHILSHLDKSNTQQEKTAKAIEEISRSNSSLATSFSELKDRVSIIERKL